jgi:spore germination cell wall hydrolase CwlJ-like protein
MGLLKDNAEGATHYIGKGANPKWMRGLTPCVEIGAHRFFNDVR